MAPADLHSWVGEGLVCWAGGQVVGSLDWGPFGGDLDGGGVLDFCAECEMRLRW